MALINCPECGKQVSDKADKCIHCGYPFQTIGENSVPRINNTDIDSRRFVEISRDELAGKPVYSPIKAFFVGGLSNCPTCGKPIAHNAKRCPHCGRRDPFILSHMIMWIIVLIIIAILLFGRK